uniref:Uncharacterized protein n=1 Tax=Heterosigma akashiwo TaxID=2829 RepID=A0A7S3UVH9_HETAK
MNFGRKHARQDYNKRPPVDGRKTQERTYFCFSYKDVLFHRKKQPRGAGRPPHLGPGEVEQGHQVGVGERVVDRGLAAHHGHLLWNLTKDFLQCIFSPCFGIACYIHV